MNKKIRGAGAVRRRAAQAMCCVGAALAVSTATAGFADASPYVAHGPFATEDECQVDVAANVLSGNKQASNCAQWQGRGGSWWYESFA